MKLYYSKGACSLAVRIVILEIGLNAQYESVNLKTKVTEQDTDFLKINPKGAVPVLVLDNNEILTENCAIQQYLADKNNATQLLPKQDDFKRYRVIEMLNFVSTDLHKGCGPLFNPAVPEELKEKIFKPNVKSKLKWVNDGLKQKKFLLGDDFTLADAYLFVILLWTGKLKIEIQDLPDLTRYFAELKKRKSIQQALTEEGLVLS